MAGFPLELVVLLIAAVAGILIGVAVENFILGFVVLAAGAIAAIALLERLGPGDRQGAIARVRRRLRQEAHS